MGTHIQDCYSFTPCLEQWAEYFPLNFSPHLSYIILKRNKMGIWHIEFRRGCHSVALEVR